MAQRIVRARPHVGFDRAGRNVMSRILIVYATDQGQTARIVSALAAQLEAAGHTVQPAELAGGQSPPDPTGYDAVIAAASVHAGRHQKRALHFVRQHRAALEQRPAAFLSVSLLAAATRPAGRKQAAGQVETFLRTSGWRPPLVEMAAGAFRPSELSWQLRLRTWLLGKLLWWYIERLGWPADLDTDREFTDWDALRRFGERFAATVAEARPMAPDAPERMRVPA